MLLVIAAILGVLWLLGLIAIHISSPLLHLLLIIAVIVVIYDLLVRRRSV